MTSLARLWILKKDKKKEKKKGHGCCIGGEAPIVFRLETLATSSWWNRVELLTRIKPEKKLGLAHSVRRKEKPLVAAHRRIWFTVTRSNFFCFLWLLAAHENEWKNCIFLMAWQIGSYCPVVSNQLFTKNPKQQSLHSRHCVISVNLTPCIRPMEEGQQEITINH